MLTPTFTANPVMLRLILVLSLFMTLAPVPARAAGNESPRLKLETHGAAGGLSLIDKAAGVAWDLGGAKNARLTPDGRSVILSVTLTTTAPAAMLDRALAIAPGESGCALVPAREGLMIPADGPKEFTKDFPTFGYEGCHLCMMGFVKRGAALLVSWDADPYIAPALTKNKSGLTCTIRVRRPPFHKSATFTLTLTPLGKGDWNTVAAAYREVARAKGLVVTLADKARRNPETAKLFGASNAKLWQCLARRRNEESTKDEWVKVNWTFDEAAQLAEHLKHDLGIDRCLFTLGGWTEGGYDCRHPDALPANTECGGDAALADAVRRIKALGYVACFHDNYQDMYRDAKSWNPAFIMKSPNGSLKKGGRWMGGRAYLVCAPKMLELARRPQNLPAIQKLFAPQAYFIDTTYAVDPFECFAPDHPLTRADDIQWKAKLSDYARGVFGLFGSECGREWAIPHSDFFEGLSGVRGKYYHDNIDPAALGATVVPLFEMVYHDCEAVYGKYGYRPEEAAEYVIHHILCARTLNYHKFPNHLYWKNTEPETGAAPARDGRGCFANAEGGWAAGLGLTDRFVKNTHEILGPLNALTAHSRLARFEFLTPGRAVRRATWAGPGGVTATVTVNLGATPYTMTAALGQSVTLPQWGFLIESPTFVAFHATSWGGRGYAKPTLFTIRLDGSRTRIFHAFGDPRLNWGGRELTVPRETAWRPAARIGVLTDTHYDRMLFPRRAATVRQALATFNQQGVGLVLALGDLYEGHFTGIDDYRADRARFEPVWRTSKAPVRWVLGNHDNWGITGAQFVSGNPFIPKVNDTRDLPGNWRIVMYSNVDGRYFSAAPATLDWLRDTLERARRDGKFILIATHARIDQDYPGDPPLWTKEPYSAYSYNSAEQRKIVEDALARGARIKAVINGHQHKNDRATVKGVAYETFATMGDEGAGATIDLKEEGTLAVVRFKRAIVAEAAQRAGMGPGGVLK